MAIRRRGELYIPEAVKASISQHLYLTTARAVDGYISASEDEDVLTGNLGASLRVNTQRVLVVQDEINGTRTWSIDYYKFRGRGKDATEKLTGADGIFELIVTSPTRAQKKSLLFQAKNNWTNDIHLLEQSIKLSNWREAAFILNYLPNQIEAYLLDDVMKSRGIKSEDVGSMPLADFLSRNFLDCLVGDRNLAYDAISKKLLWKNTKGKLISTKFSVGHRFSIRVTPPSHKDSPRVHAEIPKEEIHSHRMQSTNEELLSLEVDFTERDLQRAKRSLNTIYHPDKFKYLLEQQYVIILTKRSQEFNVASDEVSSSFKKKR